MTKKIEEVFDLPPIEHEVNAQYPTDQEEQTTGLDLEKMQKQLEQADKIDAALPQVRDLEALDSDMDKYADKAMTNAITAKTAKMDKKLKMVQLQLQKAKLDHAESKVKGGDTAIQGEAEEFEDRNSLINAVIAKMEKNGN